MKTNMTIKQHQRDDLKALPREGVTSTIGEAKFYHGRGRPLP